MSAALSPQAQASQDRLVEKLPTAFFVLAKRDAALAIAMHAQCDLVEDGCYKEAMTLNQAIATRLQLLALAQGE